MLLTTDFDMNNYAVYYAAIITKASCNGCCNTHVACNLSSRLTWLMLMAAVSTGAEVHKHHAAVQTGQHQMYTNKSTKAVAAKVMPSPG
jgi:hypothetical protein